MSSVFLEPGPAPAVIRAIILHDLPEGSRMVHLKTMRQLMDDDIILYLIRTEHEQAVKVEISLR